MLVLTRKVNQSVRVGEDIIVTVLRVKGNVIRLGIEAPRSVRVVRGELPALSEAELAARPQRQEIEFSLSDLDNSEGTFIAPLDVQEWQDDRSGGGPLSGFFPRSVTLAVGSVSV